jgi:hypothetical protein
VQVRDEVSVERHVERRAVDDLVEQYVHAAHSVQSLRTGCAAG